MNKKNTRCEQVSVNDLEYERRLIKAVMELKDTMHEVVGYAG